MCPFHRGQTWQKPLNSRQNQRSIVTKTGHYTNLNIVNWSRRVLSQISAGPPCRGGFRGSPRPECMRTVRIWPVISEHVAQVGLTAKVLSGRQGHPFTIGKHFTSKWCSRSIGKCPDHSVWSSTECRSDACKALTKACRFHKVAGCTVLTVAVERHAIRCR